MLKPLADVLVHWRPQATAGGDPLARASEAWPTVVGAEIARHSHPLHISGDALVVATRSSAWSEQLSFLAERILASLRDEFGLNELARLRFRAGKLARRAPTRVIRGTTAGRPRPPRQHERAATTEEAIERFRAAVARLQRAKSGAGWKECRRCATLIPPGDRATCTACEVLIARDRERFVARLLFEVPWLGYAGTAALVDGLERSEYDAIRTRLLARWWETLVRAARSGRPKPDRRERLIASSYVIVRSGLEPEEIAPATVRNVLGDEIFEFLYGVRE